MPPPSKRPLRYRRPLAACVATFALSMAAWIIFHDYPILILATGYEKLYILQPLKQMPYPDSELLYETYYTLNWDEDEKELHINAAAVKFFDMGWGFEWDMAPPGCFIVAALPEGVGFAWNQNSTVYASMSGPHIFPYYAIPLVMLVVCFTKPAILAARALLQYPEGCCAKCGYSLQGNVSGICPECGMPTTRLNEEV